MSTFTAGAPSVRRRIAAYFEQMATSRPGSLRIGPFALLLDPHDPNPYRNYAVPIGEAPAEPGEIEALKQAFAGHDRRPRLEYPQQDAGGLFTRLRAAGFELEAELPLLANGATSPDVPTPEGFRLELATAEDDLRAAAAAQNLAYGAGPVTAHDMARLARTLQDGGAVVLARCVSTGEAAGAVLYPRPFAGAVEIAALGVAAPYRGQGLGGALTATITAVALERGVDLPFLMAGDASERRMFERLGFETAGVMAQVSTPAVIGQ
jgi:GNAT superfamily N-acetyltransferase